MELVALASFAGVIVFGILFIILILKRGSLKLPGIGMIVCFTLLIVSVILIAKGNQNPTANKDSGATGKVTQSVGESDSVRSEEVVPTKKSEDNNISLVDQLNVVEYSYKSSAYRYYIMVIENNSMINADVSVSVTFLDADGKLVGAKNAEQEAIESGYSAALYFIVDEEYASVEYDISAEKERRYECVQSDLSYEATEAKDKVILSVTNNGDEPAWFVQATVLFFNEGKLVDHSCTYTIDDDSQIKPGKTINKEMRSYETFDSYQVFLTGRR